MEATISESMGYCILDTNAPEHAKVICLDTLTALEVEKERFSLCLADDWKVISGKNEELILKKAQKLSKHAQCVSLIQLRLLSETLCKEDQDDFYNSIEDLVQNYCNLDSLINSLLIAPLNNPNHSNIAAKESLSCGFGATGNLFNRLFEYQSLLRRITSKWISLDDDFFPAETISSKKMLWKEWSNQNYITKLLDADRKGKINSVFGDYCFSIKSVPKRAMLVKVGHRLDDLIFGEESNNVISNNTENKHDRHTFIDYHVDNSSNHEKHAKAQAQIEAINQCIENGDEYNIFKYIDELTESQIADNSEFALKSLCSIAKNSEEMFRGDIESYCLQKALQINPADQWTLIQFSDFLKRQGSYDDANSNIDKAASYGGEEETLIIIQSLKADIISKQGDWSEAISTYKKIQNWENTTTIRTAIADNLRRIGSLDDSLREYIYIEQNLGTSQRVTAGKAEIEKKKGSFSEAIDIYKSLLESSDLDPMSLVVYQTSYASLLKQTGDFSKALDITQNIITKFPYALNARVLKSSLLGLMGNEIQGLSDLDDTTSQHPTYKGWIREYTKGLLLLRTNQFLDAKTTFMDNFESTLVEHEGKKILRLASALSFLAEKESIEARSFLFDSENINDSYLEYLSDIMKYHIFTLENDEKNINALYEALYKRRENNVFLWRAVKEIQQDNQKAALKIEIDGLLRYAAIAA